MARFVKYAIARVTAHAARDERLNIALIIFNRDGLDIRIGKRLDKVRAISGAIDPNQIHDRFKSLVNVDRALIDDGVIEANERWQTLIDLGFADLSAMSDLDCSTAAAYEDGISLLMKGLIEPEPSPLKVSAKRSRLLSTVKLALRREGILARPGDELSDHRVMPNVSLAEGLIADLVLKNGAMHIVETIDASSIDISPRKIVTDIALSALILEQARICFGEDSTKANLIYNASVATEAIAMPSLKAAEHQGANLINWESHDDQRRFITHLSSLAVPYEPRKSLLRPNFLTTSQERLKLN